MGIGAFTMGAFGCGIWGIAPAYVTERYPTEARGVGPGFCYHAAAAIGALMPLLIGMMDDPGVPLATGGALGSLTLAASAIGGVLFGTLADRRGRRAGIITSVLMYSLFTAACGIAQTVWQLAIFRFLLGLGMGGAWTAGAALVSESWPDRHRGKAIGLMQSAWAIGYGGAALLSAFVLPRYGWRAMFLIGGLPALAVLWIRANVEESDIWKGSRGSRGAGGSLMMIFKAPYRRITISIVALSL